MRRHRRGCGGNTEALSLDKGPGATYVNSHWVVLNWLVTVGQE